MGGKLPQSDLSTAISEMQGTKKVALVTFPMYDWDTKWHNYGIYILTWKSKISAANGSYFLE